MAITHEYKKVDINLLHENDKNPNMHPQAQIDALVKFIKTYGQYSPVVCDENYLILDGHGKKTALQQCGITEVDVCQITGLSDKQKQKILVEANKIQSLSAINYSALEDLLREIGDTDIIGFDETYLDAIINDVAVDNAGVDFTEPEPTPAQVQTQAPKYTPEVQQKEEENVAELEQGMQKARTIRCPHCGQEITL